MSHYDNGYQDGKEGMGARYPKGSITDFEEYRRGFINGFMARMMRDAERFSPLHTYTVCLHQRAIVQAHRYVNVLATSEEEAKQLAEEGEQIQDDLAWQNELKDWA